MNNPFERNHIFGSTVRRQLLKNYKEPRMSYVFKIDFNINKN